MKVDIVVLSCDRYEMLSCCLSSVCGLNAGAGRVTVLDDASTDPRVSATLSRLHERRYVSRVVSGNTRRGIGVQRDWATHWQASGECDHAVQIEGDILCGPGSIAALVGAQSFTGGRLCAYGFPAFHKRLATLERRDGLRCDQWDAQGESLWCIDHATLTRHLDAVTPHRPDLIPLDRAAGCYSVVSPAIRAQHLGCVGASFYYPKARYPWATWEALCYRDERGQPTQPIDGVPVDFPALEADYPRGHAALARAVLATVGDAELTKCFEL